MASSVALTDASCVASPTERKLTPGRRQGVYSTPFGQGIHESDGCHERGQVRNESITKRGDEDLQHSSHSSQHYESVAYSQEFLSNWLGSILIIFSSPQVAPGRLKSPFLITPFQQNSRAAIGRRPIYLPILVGLLFQEVCLNAPRLIDWNCGPARLEVDTGISLPERLIRPSWLSPYDCSQKPGKRYSMFFMASGLRPWGLVINMMAP